MLQTVTPMLRRCPLTQTAMASMIACVGSRGIPHRRPVSTGRAWQAAMTSATIHPSKSGAERWNVAAGTTTTRSPSLHPCGWMWTGTARPSCWWPSADGCTASMAKPEPQPTSPHHGKTPCLSLIEHGLPQLWGTWTGTGTSTSSLATCSFHRGSLTSLCFPTEERSCSRQRTPTLVRPTPCPHGSKTSGRKPPWTTLTRSSSKTAK